MGEGGRVEDEEARAPGDWTGVTDTVETVRL